MHTIIRTTLGEYLAKPQYTGSGIYVISCYPSLGCLYVGIGYDVLRRIRQHLTNDGALGMFLRNVMADACGFGLDIHVLDDREYMIAAERKLIQWLRPMFNEAGLGGS